MDKTKYTEVSEVTSIPQPTFCFYTWRYLRREIWESQCSYKPDGRKTESSCAPKKIQRYYLSTNTNYQRIHTHTQAPFSTFTCMYIAHEPFALRMLSYLCIRGYYNKQSSCTESHMKQGIVFQISVRQHSDRLQDSLLTLDAIVAKRLYEIIFILKRHSSRLWKMETLLRSRYQLIICDLLSSLVEILKDGNDLSPYHLVSVVCFKLLQIIFASKLNMYLETYV